MSAVVVDVTDREQALAAAATGATVVLVGSDAATAGALARAVDDAGGRAVVFVGEPGRAALAEMLVELLRPPR